MKTMKLSGLLIILAVFAFACGNNNQGGDASTETTNESEDVTANDVSMKDKAAPMEEPEATASDTETDGESAATWDKDMAEEEPSASETKTQMDSKPKATSTPASSTQRIAYREGTTSQVRGTIQGTNTQQYISALPAKALTFTLLTDNPAARLMVTDTGGKRLSRAGQEVTYTAPSQGDYLIKVFMNMANEASSEKADYRLQIRAAE